MRLKPLDQLSLVHWGDLDDEGGWLDAGEVVQVAAFIADGHDIHLEAAAGIIVLHDASAFFAQKVPVCEHFCGE